MQTKLYASEKNRAEREGNTKPNTTMEVITKWYKGILNV